MRRGAGFFALVLLLSSCLEPKPRIDGISPRIGLMGELVTITGRRFGGSQDESFVTIAGAVPTASSYLLWKDDEIVFRVPEFGESGLVHVHRGGRKSNPALFSNALAIPEPFSGEDFEPGPRIASVTPRSGPVGGLVTISGQNFGAAREGEGAVFFAWGAETEAPEEAAILSRVMVSGEDGYESWNDREIRVRVPDGAISGNLELRTPRGAARPEYFEVTGKPGTKAYRNKRSYAISWSANLRIDRAAPPNTFHLWVPRPAYSQSQRPGELLQRSQEPFIENYRGLSLFKFNDLASGSRVEVTLGYLVEVYAVETVLRPQEVKLPSPGQAELVHTRGDTLVPAEDPAVRALAAAITGRERNPWRQARLIYDWVIREIRFTPERRGGGAGRALEEKEADSWQGGLLFCALARAAGIPALPVSGVLVDRYRNTVRHLWAEFWIQDFGWVPVDVFLGSGAAPENFILTGDYGSYYFGNADNQRIAFSRGVVPLSRMDSRGRAVSRERDYSLQTIWEEAAGGIESYSSFWGDVVITGMYVQ